MTRVWTDQQEALFAWYATGRGNAVVTARAGSSKCLGVGTPVLMFDGRVVPVETIRKGDRLMGPDSRPRRVLSTGTGIAPLYRILPVKGEPWICNGDHVLVLAGTNHDMGRTLEITVDECRAQDWRIFGRRWKLCRTGVDFSLGAPVPVHPYLVGIWLGDGTRGTASITNRAPEIEAFCREIAPLYGTEFVSIETPRNNSKTLRFRSSRRGEAMKPNTLVRFFETECLDAARGKVIPPGYLQASRADRLELLAGLLDTDGCLARGGYTIVSKWPVLADQIAYLARSLGFAAYTFEREGRIESLNFVGAYRSVSIAGKIDEIPCKVERKKASPRRQVKRPSVTGFTIEPVGPGDYYGFTLSGDGRFLLGDFTVTHNTTAALEGLRRRPAGESALVCAFNKAIASELEARVPIGVKAQTLHAAGLRCLKRSYPRCEVDFRRGRRLAQRALGIDGSEWWHGGLIGCVSRLASWGKGSMLRESGQLLRALGDADAFPSSTAEHNGFGVERVADAALAAMRAAVADDGAIDFDDMIWCALERGCVRGEYGIVVVDEAADMNRSQLDLATRICKSGGRICAVGDPMQALYGWRGADVGAIERMGAELRAADLRLSKTFRCAQSIVREAQVFVPDIEGFRPEEGIVRHDSLAALLSGVRPGDFVLSRTNAALLKVALLLARAGVPVCVRGRDLAKQLLSRVSGAQKRGGTTVGEVVRIACDALAREQETATNLGADDTASRLADLAECLIALSAECSSVGELLAVIDRVFADAAGAGQVVCSTVHQAKGLETERVWILRDTFAAWNGRRRGGPTGEDRRVAYVAVTRAKNELVYCSDALLRKEPSGS